MSFFRDNTDITDGVEAMISKAVVIAIENNSAETFKVLRTFVSDIIQLSILNKSKKHFEVYLNISIFFYNASFYKAKRNPELKEFHEYCSKQVAILQKNALLYYIGLERRQNIDMLKLAELNEYYYIGFSSFSGLLYSILRNFDLSQFKFALNEFDQVSDNSYGRFYDLKWEIKRLIIEDVNGFNSDLIQSKKESLRVLKAFNEYRRHTIASIRYWIIFLYRENLINEEAALSFLEGLIVRGDNDDLLQDVLFFRGPYSQNYMGWSEWDFMERPSGVTYSPPNPAKWLTFGFMVDQIQWTPIYINIQELSSEDLFQASFLYEDLKDCTDYFKDNFDKWKRILNAENIENLVAKCEGVLRVFAELKKKNRGDSDIEIANAQINSIFVDNFKNLVGKVWKNQSRIHQIFKLLGDSELVTDDETKLRIIGQRTFFEKAKIMFIEGDHHQTIFGVERMGGEIGRWEDDEFFSAVMKGEYNTVTGDNIAEVIIKAIVELKRDEITPDLILLSPEYGHRDFSLLDYDMFVPKMNEQNGENDIMAFCIGKFDNIPIYTSFSDFLKNRILVCNFRQSFKMKYKTNPVWFENEFKVEISGVTQEEAIKRLADNPIKWKKAEEGIALTDEEAITLIKTSVIIDLCATVDFQILNKHSYVIGFIKGN